jgi:translation initiation factor 2 subunit 1
MGSFVAKLTEFPEEGELVVGTVHKVQNFGAFILLEEYGGKEGFCHIREVASGWVKRIRDFVREQQRVVCKVQGVSEAKGHIDLSLKAVNDHQRRETIQRWKNEQKADKLIEMFAERIGMDAPTVTTMVVKQCLGVWETMYDAFTDAAELGPDVFAEEKITGDWIPEFIVFSKENIQAQFVEVVGFVEVQSNEPNGVKVLQKALKAAEKSEFEDVKIRVTYKGSPYYRVEVHAPDYKIGEEQLRKAADRAIETVTKGGGRGGFHREIDEKKA